MIPDLKDIDVENWPAQDEKAEADAWQQVIEKLQEKKEMLPEPVITLLKETFSLGFSFGLKHQGERMNIVMKSIKNKLKEGHERD